jgi:hypothetical protein
VKHPQSTQTQQPTAASVKERGETCKAMYS